MARCSDSQSAQYIRRGSRNVDSTNQGTDAFVRNSQFVPAGSIEQPDPPALDWSRTTRTALTLQHRSFAVRVVNQLEGEGVVSLQTVRNDSVEIEAPGLNV